MGRRRSLLLSLSFSSAYSCCSSSMRRSSSLILVRVGRSTATEVAVRRPLPKRDRRDLAGLGMMAPMVVGSHYNLCFSREQKEKSLMLFFRHTGSYPPF